MQITRSAAKFGAPPPVPFLSLYMTDDEVLGGVNFASGGAGLLNETGIYFVSYKTDVASLHVLLNIPSTSENCNMTTNLQTFRFSTCRSTTRYRPSSRSRTR
jgi:hypothetical protein